MKIIYYLSLLVLVYSCKSKQPKIEQYQIPKDWIQLTKTDSALIIFNSCDHGNLLINISDSNILLMGTQEDYKYKIEQINYLKNGSIAYILSELGNKDKLVFKFRWIDLQQGIGEWELRFNEKNITQEYFVSKINKKLFKEYNQPIKECWEEEVVFDEESQIKAIKTIRTIFEEFKDNQESVDSEDNKEAIKTALQNIHELKVYEDIKLLLDVWLYYDPTDFPTRKLIEPIFIVNESVVTEAIFRRIKYKYEWEDETGSAIEDLNNLKYKLIPYQNNN